MCVADAASGASSPGSPFDAVPDEIVDEILTFLLGSASLWRGYLIPLALAARRFHALVFARTEWLHHLRQMHLEFLHTNRSARLIIEEAMSDAMIRTCNKC